MIHQGIQEHTSHQQNFDGNPKSGVGPKQSQPQPTAIQPGLRTRIIHQKKQLFDFIRRKWVADTPEERVRQELLRSLTSDFGYPVGQISIERRAIQSVRRPTTSTRLPRTEATANPLGRFDALLRTTEGKPLLLIECKAPGTDLDQSVFDQAAVYNYTLNAPFLLLCNGPEFLMAQIDTVHARYVFSPEIPHYSCLLALVQRQS